MNVTPRLSAKDITRLPVEEIQLTDRMAVDIRVLTPHKGKVLINTKELHSGMFKSTTEHSVNQRKIIKEIRDLEKESIDYLFNNWLVSTNPPQNHE